MTNERMRGNEIGPTGTEVGTNVGKLRRAQGLSLKDLEARLEKLGRPIAWSGISKLENGSRKVDADDLVALAIALDTSPLGLLLPRPDKSDDSITITGASGEAQEIWEWAVGSSPLQHEDFRGFQARSLPWWLQVLTDIPSSYAQPTARAASAPAPSATEEPMDVERTRAIQSFIAHGLRLDNLGGGLVIGGRVVTQEEIDLVAAMSDETLPEPDDSWNTLHMEVKATNVEHPQTP